MGKVEPATFESLERIGYSVVSQLRRRLALAAVEISEEQIRFARVLAWQLVALLFSCLTAAFFALLVVATFWDTGHRVAAIALIAAVTGIAAAGMWWMHRHNLRSKPVLLAQTLAELEKDAQALDPTRGPHA